MRAKEGSASGKERTEESVVADSNLQ